jgi:hypothetical protein
MYFISKYMTKRQGGRSTILGVHEMVRLFYHFFYLVWWRLAYLLEYTTQDFYTDARDEARDGCDDEDLSDEKKTFSQKFKEVRF